MTGLVLSRALGLVALVGVCGCSAPPLKAMVPGEFLNQVPEDEEPGYTYMSGRTMGGRIWYPKERESFETGFRTAGGKVAREGDALEVKAALVYDAELPPIQRASMALRFCGPLPEDGEARWDLIHAAIALPPLEVRALELPEDGISLTGSFTRPLGEFPGGEGPGTALVSVFFLDAQGIAVLEVLPLPVEAAPAEAPQEQPEDGASQQD
ncbi:MAG: hypothetical protein R3F62_21875 [Planctomycetota bacterium]